MKTLTIKEFQTLLNELILHESFVEGKITFPKKEDIKKVIMRPVLLKGKYHLQISCLFSKKDITKNYNQSEIDSQLNELFDKNPSNFYIKTTDKDVQIKKSKNRFKVSYHKQDNDRCVSYSHNKPKNYLISPDIPNNFLRVVGIQKADGKIQTDKWRKFHQINEFLRIVDETVDKKTIGKSITVADLGCGNAYLTFALYHYFSQILTIKTILYGVDSNKELMERNMKRANELSWHNVTFFPTLVSTFNPPSKPDIVLALHACDIATDDSLASAIKWKAKYIFAAPCCHKNIQMQMRSKKYPPAMEEILQTGIYKERFGDMLTDTFRALILRKNGYKVDIFQFVSSEDTAKNIMIRAIKKGEGDTEINVKIDKLKSAWKIKPYLENLLYEK